MRKIVIGINNSTYANQFGLNDFSGAVTVGQEVIEYFIHTSPVIKISPRTKLLANFDILIDNTHSLRDSNNVNFETLLPEHCIFNNDRTAKSIMRYKMDKAARELGIKKYIPIRHWANDNTLLPNGTGRYGNDVGYGTHDMRVVIKDEHGARGAGQVLFNITEHSPGTVMKVMRSVQNMAKDQPLLGDDVLMTEIKSRLPHISVGYDTTIGIRETLDKLSSNPSYIEEFVPGIDHEYRMLVSPTTSYVFERMIENVDGYPQACGSRGGMKHPISNDSKLSRIAEDAKRLLQKAGWVYGSVDLFTSGDRWGIFECSSQYAADGVIPHYSAEIQESFIQWLIARYIQGESLNKS